MKIKTNPIKTSAIGYYSFTVKDEEGYLVEEKCSKTPTQNVVTYDGAVASLTNTSTLDSNIFRPMYCKVGTGSTEITRLSNSLGNPLTPTTNSVTANRAGNEVDNLDGTSTVTTSRTVEFSLGEIDSTISEVGLYIQSGNIFVAGQLIKDEFGDPTTVTILPTEQLTITYVVEWTVPNAASLIGSGTVDADGTSTNYEVWAQPYFSNYTVGDDNKNKRYGLPDTYSTVALLNSDGTTYISNAGDLGTGWSKSHDGSGTLTYSTAVYSFSPSDFNTTDLAFIGYHPFYLSSTQATNNLASTASPVVNVSDDNATCSLYIKFSPAITKTDQQSLSIQVEFTVTV